MLAAAAVAPRRLQNMNKASSESIPVSVRPSFIQRIPDRVFSPRTDVMTSADLGV